MSSWIAGRTPRSARWGSIRLARYWTLPGERGRSPPTAPWVCRRSVDFIEFSRLRHSVTGASPPSRGGGDAHRFHARNRSRTTLSRWVARHSSRRRRTPGQLPRAILRWAPSSDLRRSLSFVTNVVCSSRDPSQTGGEDAGGHTSQDQEQSSGDQHDFSGWSVCMPT